MEYSAFELKVAFGIVAVSLLAYFIRWMKLKPVSIHFSADVIASAQNKKYPTYENVSGKHVVVTGGSGFLGRHIVDALVEQDCHVTVFDIINAKFESDKVTMYKGDLTKKEDVIAALKGAEIVFHVASPHPNSNNVKLFEAVNVLGTQNVVDACKINNVGRLIFTSSASVVFDGTDQKGVNESIPYPTQFRDPYSRTKAEAEQIVLNAGKNYEKLCTVAIRPHGLYGPRDPQLVPTLVEMAKVGKTKFAIGDTSNVVDFTYIGNVVHSHLLAASKCMSNASNISGKSYFITNDEPIQFWTFMGYILTMLSYDPPSLRLPYYLLLSIAHIAQFVAKTFNFTLTLSPARIVIAGTHHWYCIDAAKHDLGYEPIWTMHEGLYLTQQFFRHCKNPRPRKRLVDRETAAQRGEGVSKWNGNEDELPTYTMEEVSQHDHKTDLWIVVKDKVYDVTNYVERHPGGDAIFKHAGADNTKGFFGPQHPDSAHDALSRYLIGRIVSPGDLETSWKSYSMEQVEKHNSAKDCWVVVDGKVYDLTTFVEKHPGGRDALTEFAGKDGSEPFHRPHHPSNARQLLQRYVIGLVSHDSPSKQIQH